MSKNPLRRLVVDGQVYLYSMRWDYDRDGERVVTVAVYPADPDAPRRRSGRPLRAKFVSRDPEYPAPTATALPGDVRAMLDRGRALGWTGARETWLLPENDLERPHLVLSTPTRLREWAGERPLHIASLELCPLAAELAGDLGLALVPASRGAAELQWRDERRTLLRSRWGRFVGLYALEVGALIEALAVIERRVPSLAVSLRSTPSRIVGPGPGELPAAAVVPPDHWAAQPGVRRYRGPRDGDVVWAFTADDGPRVECYQYHAEDPTSLWRWATLGDSGSIERRFRRREPATDPPGPRD